MWNLEACAVCLSTGRKLFDMDDWEQREDFNSVARLNTYAGDGLLSYLCVECSAYVKRFKKFQTKCQRANDLLQEMLNKKEQINHLNISSINREIVDILPSLAYWKTESCHYEETKFQWADNNDINIIKYSDVPIFFISITGNFDFTPKSELDSSEHLDNDKETINIDTVDNCQNVPNYVEIEVTKIDNEKQNIIYEVPSADEDDYQDDVVNCVGDTVEAAPAELAAEAGGSTLDQQYANFYPLSDNEQKVVAEITKLFSSGPYKCSICSKGYYVKSMLENHMKHHEKDLYGSILCELCGNNFRSKFLLISHMNDKHLYKYVCTKCPEVNFDRVSAKEHYIRSHLQAGLRKYVTCHDVERGWIRCGNRTKAANTHKGTKEIKKELCISDKPKIKVPANFFIRTPLGHLEQYELINERQKSKNYMESKFKCELCFRGFVDKAAFNNHIKKHDPKYSGPCMCDVCKLYFKNTRKMYTHVVTTHLFKYNCQKCQFVSYNSTLALLHYKWHENVTYSCPHCDKEFTKQSTQLGHIRIKHPSINICNICGHSFIKDVGLNCHMLRTHSKKEIELSEQLSQQVSQEGELYCGDCKMHFASDEAFRVHLGSSNKHATVNLSVMCKKRMTSNRPRTSSSAKAARTVNSTSTDCDKCGKHFTSNLKARKHYDVAHPSTDMLQLCDICGYSTQNSVNLLTHMRTHTKEQPFACSYCDRRFTTASNRDRHHLIHTGEKRYECSHCHRRFAHKSGMKLHIQTVHLKIPYAPWNKKNRKRRPKPELNDSKLPCMPKVLAETQGEYLDAFISYQDEITHGSE